MFEKIFPLRRYFSLRIFLLFIKRKFTNLCQAKIILHVINFLNARHVYLIIDETSFLTLEGLNRKIERNNSECVLDTSMGDTK